MNELTQKEFNEAPPLIQYIYMQSILCGFVGISFVIEAKQKYPQYFTEQERRSKAMDAAGDKVCVEFRNKVDDMVRGAIREYEEAYTIPDGATLRQKIDFFTEKNPSRAREKMNRELEEKKETLWQETFGRYLKQE